MIEVKEVSMRYGKTLALDGVSFVTEKGKIVGLVGPNGAGKTTLMRILTTYLYPAEGTALVGGFDITQNPLEVRNLLGYMPETVPLYDDMMVDEYLSFIGNSRGFYAGRLNERLKWVREHCGLVPIWKHVICEISKGYRQRVGLAQALIHDPSVLILDEPMTGLDPLQIISIRSLIRSLSKEKTVIFSTHIFQEVQALAERIVILNNGRVIADGTHSEITNTATKGERVVLVVRAEKDEADRLFSEEEIIDDYRFAGIESEGYVKYIVSASAGKPLSRRINEIVEEKNWLIKEMRQEKATLEEAFIWLLSKTSGKKEALA